ncbi:MAG: hypothetical protein ACFFAO_06885, partial [Candidatus Hermodarchaeota archaeon]
MKKKKRLKFLILTLFINLIILNIIQFNYQTNKLSTQQEKSLLKTATEIKYSNVSGIINDTKSIQIKLLDLTWNITDIQVNFTDLKQYRQLRTIEENISVSSFKALYYDNLLDYVIRFGQQINFSEPTEVYGVYIYGFKTIEATEIVEVELRGFEESNHKPNTTEYITPQPLNISNNLGWYYQNFSGSSPLILQNSNYYLLINGEDLWGGGSDPYYYFGCNLKS